MAKIAPPPKINQTFKNPGLLYHIMDIEPEIKNRLEAVLFTVGRFIDTEELARICNIGSSGIIKEALREAKNLMKTLSSTYKSEGLKDTTPNIKQYRDWYWKHAFGMTYQQIADEWEKQNKVSIGYEDVAEAINTYQKMLV